MNDYEMAATREWRRPEDAAVRRAKWAQGQYDLVSLDADWYPILAPALVRADTTDYGRLVPQRQPTILDEIDGRGRFSARDLERELKSMHRHELEGQLGISWTKVRDIIARSDYDRDGFVEYKDFLETVRHYRLNTEQASAVTSLVKAFAYAEEFTCSPPPFFMLAITLAETAFFLYHCVHLSAVHNLDITWNGPVPYCSRLIFNPHRRWEAWRYLTYMFVHIGISHFIFNMIMQILVGVFLEMQQEGATGSFRVMAVYFSGVVAGSLGTSLSDPSTYIAGASGGCYALIAAHLATMALNWHEDGAVRIRKVIHKPLTKIVRIVFIVFLTVHDVALAIYVRVTSNEEDRTGFMGHFCGALAGLLVGIFILDNRRVSSWEPAVQWISLLFFVLLVAFAVIWNIFGNEWTGGTFFLPPDYEFYDDDCKIYSYI